MKMTKPRTTCSQVMFAIFAMIAPLVATAGTSTPDAKVVLVQTGTSAWVIELDPTIAITAPFNCSTWSGSTIGLHRLYISPITDDASRAKLANAMLAFASGKLVRIAASSCNTSNYPVIDNIAVIQ
jgi:hypothetical protein